MIKKVFISLGVILYCASGYGSDVKNEIIGMVTNKYGGSIFANELARTRDVGMEEISSSIVKTHKLYKFICYHRCRAYEFIVARAENEVHILTGACDNLWLVLRLEGYACSTVEAADLLMRESFLLTRDKYPSCIFYTKKELRDKISNKNNYPPFVDGGEVPFMNPAGVKELNYNEITIPPAIKFMNGGKCSISFSVQIEHDLVSRLIIVDGSSIKSSDKIINKGVFKYYDVK